VAGTDECYSNKREFGKEKLAGGTKDVAFVMRMKT
jgi:hypothetical protein